ncbi:MAG: glycoside hydrolase family 3 C-terminal domain-containing protein [Armatimonadetes bacterium]|nr:glycoside hydrolase family 3 C-terminal domain-containing protein [Armatimonadota bacterium]
MDIREKIGQMLMFGWQGQTEHDNQNLCTHSKILTDDFKVGGIILLGRNVRGPEQIASTLNELQGRSDIPMFIAADQEGGLITRMKHPFTTFPGNMALGATRSAEFARECAGAIARELAAVGVNTNFAPCVDVNNNPLNPIIGIRSYGESPEMVSELGAAAVEGFQSNGIMACAKHFPGHGDTSTDTHLSMPSIPYQRKRLNKVELAPFRACIKAGVAMVMSTHIVFTALDPSMPATLSPAVLTGLLRKHMGFGGLIVTDCMEMKAVTANYGVGEASVLAVKAGTDILLASHTLEAQAQIRTALLKAVESGEISEERIEESVARIMAVKSEYGLDQRRTTDISTVRESVGTETNRSLEREIAESSVTVLRNDGAVLPLKLMKTDQVLVAGLHPATEQFAAALRKYHPNTRLARISNEPTEKELAAVRELIKQSKVVILTTCQSEPWTRELVRPDPKSETGNGRPAVIIAAREPYDLCHYPDAKASVATYGYPDATVQAAADMLFGRIQPVGKLPVSIPGYAKFGFGLEKL